MARVRDSFIGSWLPPFALLALTFIAYLPATRASFIWDDPDYVVNNPTLRTTEGLYNIWFHPHALPQYYPLVHTTFWLEFQLTRLDPTLYHIDNILLHALSSILLWRILKKLNIPGGLFAACVFAIHPLNVESVAWITERKNVLSALLYFASALAYLHFAFPPVRQSSIFNYQSPILYILSLILFILSLLSKTVTCSLPAALLLILLWKRNTTRRTLLPLIPMFLIGAALALYTAHLESTHVGAHGQEWNFTPLDRILIASRALCFYPAKLLIPINQSFIYPKWPINPHNPIDWLYPTLILITLILLIALRKKLTSAPLLAFLLYAGSALPALGFVNIYPMRYTFVADHYVYLAMVPLIALVSAILVRWTPRPFPVVLLLPLLIATFVRAEVFQNPLTLWTDTLAKNHDSWMVHLNLAQALVQNHQEDEAATHFQRAVDLAPNLPETHGNLAMSLAARGLYDQALAQYDQALKIDPTFPEAFLGRGKIFQRLNQPGDAKREFQLAVKYFPTYADAWLQLGQIDASENNLQAAKDAFTHALSSEPFNAEALNELGKVFLKQRDFNNALTHFAAAVEANPNFAEARMNLGALLAAMGNQVEAERQVAEAVRLDPSLAKYANQALRRNP